MLVLLVGPAELCLPSVGRNTARVTGAGTSTGHAFLISV